MDDAIDLGVSALRAGELEKAATLFEAVLSIAPDHVDALQFLGITEHQRGRSDVALEWMGRAVAVAPDHPDLHNNRGNVLKAIGRLEEAERAYRRVLELRADDANALSNLGTVLRERGDLEAALDLFRHAIACRPEHVEAHTNLGNVLELLHRYEEAAEAHREALRLRPGSGDSYRRLGMMFYSIGRADEAADVYRQWLAADPASASAQHMLAACTGQEVPERASDAFVRDAFDRFAPSFERKLEKLEYRAPGLVGGEVRRRLGEGARALDVLDAGCGTGLCAPLLRPLARRLVGVDLSEGMLERARPRGLYDELVCGELVAYLEGAARAWDLVVSADTLCYFGALEGVARAAALALRAGGLLVFTVERAERDAAPAGFRLEPHGRYGHTEAYVQRVVSAAGFEGLSLAPVDLRKESNQWAGGLLVSACASRG